MGSVMRVGGGMRISQGSLPTTVVSDGLDGDVGEAGREQCLFYLELSLLVVTVEGRMLGMSKKYIRLQEKSLNEVGERGRKEKLLNS